MDCIYCDNEGDCTLNNCKCIYNNYQSFNECENFKDIYTDDYCDNCGKGICINCKYKE